MTNRKHRAHPGHRTGNGRPPPAAALIARLEAEVQDLREQLALERDDQQVQAQAWIGAHRELEFSRERYAELYESFPVGYLTLDGNGLIREANLTAAQMLGLERRKLLNTLLSRFVVKEERRRFLQHLRRCRGARGAERVRTELRIAGAEGGILDTELISILSHAGYEAPAPIQFLTALIDITDRKRAEAAVQRSRETLLLALKAGASGAFDWDAKTNANRWSDELLALYGLRPEEFGGRHEDWLAALAAEDREAAAAAMQRSLKTGEFALVFRIRRHDNGEIRWMHGRARVFFDESGQPARMIGINVDITERKRAEEALRESERRYRLLFDMNPDAVFVVDPVGRFTAANPACETLSGYPLAELLEKSFVEICPRDRLARTEEGFRRAMAGLPDAYIETAVIRKDGERREVWVSGQPVVADGKVEALHCTAKDITERKRAEAQLRALNATLEERVTARTEELTLANERLRQTEARLSFLLSSTAAVIYSATTSGRYGPTFISENVRELFGYEAREFLKHLGFWAARVHPEDRPGVLGALGKLAVGGGEKTLEYRFRHRDGTYRWTRDDVRLVKDAAGRPRELVGSWLDITRQKWAESALRQSEQALVDFFAEAPVGLLWVGPDGRILRANHVQEAMLGCRAEELFGRRLAEFSADPEVIGAVLKRLERGGAVHNDAVRVRGPDHSIRQVVIDANGLWENGKLVHSRWFVQDVTGRLELQKEILAIGERVQRRIGQDLHDDLCQRLTSIEFLTCALERQLEGSGQGQAASARARQAGPVAAGNRSRRPYAGRVREIARLVRRAITYTRELSHTMAPMQLDVEGLPGALENLAVQTTKSFHVDCRFHGDSHRVTADPMTRVYLYRIAQEAINNAIRHGKAKRIQIDLRVKEDKIMLTVGNDGVGLPPRRRTKKGSGLRIMEYRASVLGGSLAVESRKRGGACVVCSIPKTSISPITPAKP